MAEITNNPIRVLGCDVAKDHVVVFDEASGETVTVKNKAAALRRHLSGFAGPTLVVCEATGGHELVLLELSVAAGFEAHRADTRKAKAFLRSLRSHAKNDAIDARGLARYGRERSGELRRWHPPGPGFRAIAELVRVREDLVQQLADNKRRLQAPAIDLARRHLRHMIALTARRVEVIEVEIAGIIAADRELVERYEVILGAKGCGPVVSAGLLALLPELGQVSRRIIASLAGVAPHPNDTGTLRRRRRVKGGRGEVKRLLFMAALSASRYDPELKRFHDRLIDGGKPPMAALVAVARKLITIINARVRDHEAARLAV